MVSTFVSSVQFLYKTGDVVDINYVIFGSLAFFSAFMNRFGFIESTFLISEMSDKFYYLSNIAILSSELIYEHDVKHYKGNVLRHHDFFQIYKDLYLSTDDALLDAYKKIASEWYVIRKYVLTGVNVFLFICFIVLLFLVLE